MTLKVTETTQRVPRKVLTSSRNVDECKALSPGHSNGARVAATLAAELHAEGAGALAAPAGCVLFSYPLHAPGNTSKLRDAEVLALPVPTLFVRGTRDAFSHQQVRTDR